MNTKKNILLVEGKEDDARWQSLRDRLIGVGCQGVPNRPTANGTIIDPPLEVWCPRVGI